MRLGTIFVSSTEPESTLPTCDECGARVQLVRVIRVQASFPKHLGFCLKCLGKLRTILRRGERQLNPRIRSALEALAAAPSRELTELELAHAIGRYATNSIKSLCARGFAARTAAGTYEITPKGLEAVSRLANVAAA